MAEKGEKRDPVTHRTPTQMKRLSRGYNARPENVADRVKRNQARAMLEKEGRVHKGDEKDVHHKKPLKGGGSNGRSNLQVRERSKHRRGM